MTFLISTASISFLGIIAMISIRLWQIKNGRVAINQNESSFWPKTYKAILICEDKILSFLFKVFRFSGDKLSKLDIGEKLPALLGAIFGKVGGKIADIKKSVKGEATLGEKENASDFLKDISNHKENSKNDAKNDESANTPTQKDADK